VAHWKVMCAKSLKELALDGQMLSAEDLEQDLKIQLWLDASDGWCTDDQWDLDNNYTLDVSEINVLRQRINSDENNRSPEIVNGVHDIGITSSSVTPNKISEDVDLDGSAKRKRDIIENQLDDARSNGDIHKIE